MQGPIYSPRQLPPPPTAQYPHPQPPPPNPQTEGGIYFWLSILATTGVVGLMLGSDFIIELDAGLAGIS